MKRLVLQQIIPLTISSFIFINKWWYGLVIDAKDVFCFGFPLIYKCEGFHTSLSTQYFLSEMGINLLTYFIFWFVVTLWINRFWNIKIPKILSKVFWILFGILLLGFVHLSNELDDRYLIKRDFEVKIFDTGFTLLEYHSRNREKYQEELKYWLYKMDNPTIIINQ